MIPMRMLFVLPVGLIILCHLMKVIRLSDLLITVMDLEETFVCHLNTNDEQCINFLSPARPNRPLFVFGIRW